MVKFVAFLRGINVGGHRKIPMADLRRICAVKTRGVHVRSHIASGNLVFEAEGTTPELAAALADGVLTEFGFEVPVLVMNEQTMRHVLASCPFLTDAGKLVHGYLCYDDPVLDIMRVDALRAQTERVAIVGRTVWLYAPEGVGRSKLAAQMERLIGIEATARNLNTLRRMVEFLD